MAWIKTIEDEEAKGELQKIYQSLTDPETGRVDNILKIHSLHLEGLNAHLNLYKSVMKGTPGLPKVDREMIALVVSQINQCHY